MLLGGDVRNLPEMRRIAAALGPTAHVTVLVEAATASQVEEFAADGAARVTWLVRSRGGGLRPRGERLATAIHAWCAEWGCAAEGEAPLCTVWLGARTPTRIVRMTRALLPS